MTYLVETDSSWLWKRDAEMNEWMNEWMNDRIIVLPMLWDKTTYYDEAMLA